MSFSWSALHAQLLQSTTRPTMLQTFRIIAGNDSALTGFPDIGAVVAFLHHPDRDPLRKNRVLSALVRAAQTQDETCDTAQTVLLLALWPGLCGVRRRLVPLFDRTADLDAEVLGRCCEIIAALDLTRVSRIAATVLRNVERDLRRRRIRDACPAPEASAASVSTNDERNCPAAQLDQRMFGGTLTTLFGRDAPLVSAVVLYGMTQKQASRALGLSHDAVRKRFQRAMARLRTAS